MLQDEEISSGAVCSFDATDESSQLYCFLSKAAI
jgi:hypothetical protein